MSSHMHLQPFARVNDVAFDTPLEALLRRFPHPLSTGRNAVDLNEVDYGHTVYRFQDSGRLEEVTARAAILHLDTLAIPFTALGAFVRQHDAACFERAGFLVSPGFGIAFVPSQPHWVTALARHALVQWEAL